VRSRSELGEFLNERALLGSGAEVGVYTGLFSATILRRWKGERLWLIDPWTHQPDYLDSWNADDRTMARRLATARRRLKPYEGRVGWIRSRSDVAASEFAPNSLAFVYIDANHSYLHVKRDLALWFPKIRPGGLLAGHDYFNALADEAFEPRQFGDFDPAQLTSYGVKAAVDEFARAHSLQLCVTPERLPTWYAFV
jgi:hypothetical protein